MDWTRRTDDPVDRQTVQEVRDFLLSIRHIEQTGKALDYILREVADKRVLDIGMCEHSRAHIASPGWKHRRIKEACAYVLGVDILADLVSELATAGYNVRCVDATSDAFLGETFDVAVLGDVIEHVENPVALLRFAARHLADGGRIFVSTPNPHYKNHVRRLERDGTIITNLEHLAWISPSMALELGRRAGLKLHRYVCFINRSRVFRNRFSRHPLSERHTSDYLYEFVR